MVVAVVVVVAFGTTYSIARKSFNVEGLYNAFNMHSRFHVRCPY